MKIAHNKFSGSEFTLHGNCFVAELSDLQILAAPSYFTLNGGDGVAQIRFSFSGRDVSEGETMGFQYISDTGKYRALLIND